MNMRRALVLAGGLALTYAGVHIIKMKSYVAAKDPNLEDARKDVIAKIKQDKFTEAIDKYFKMLMDTNRITINPNYKQYDQRS